MKHGIAARRVYLRAVAPSDLHRSPRAAAVSRARALVAWILVRGFGWSLPRAGLYLSRHHTTVLHHIQRIEADFNAYRVELAEAIDQMLAVSRAKQGQTA